MSWRQRARQFWQGASPRTRVSIQVGVLLTAVLVAYSYSLETLVQEADLETPLAYVGLVPAIALALAAVRARPLRPEPPIHDRQIDYIVGIPLLGAVIAANALLPGKLSVMYWVWRIDLLTLPFFVAGAVAIIFGVRVLWRQKLAVGYLFLAWPYPYQSLLLRVLDAFTNLTVAATKDALHYVRVAKAVPAPDGATLFLVTHHATTFPLSVVSACSGVNSCVGFLLVGSAFGAVVSGPRMRKIGWLTGGMILLWALNIFRILFVFWAGTTWGEHLAIGILHPFIGMVTFSIGVLVMMLLIEPLGMRMNIGSRQRHEVPSPFATRYRQAVAVPKIYVATAIVLVTALVLGIANLGLKNYNLVADISGGPNLTSFILQPASPTGWNVHRIAEYDWAQPLFGDTSEWFRYELFHTEGGNLITSTPVIADVIVTPYLSSFSAYGIEACYQFHGYSLKNVAQVSIAGGIVGQTLTYTSQQYGSWTIIYWIIPVKDNGATQYQRTVLYVRNSGGLEVASDDGPVPGVRNQAGSLDPVDSQLISDRNFLVDFARELVRTEAHQPLFQEPTTALPSARHRPASPSSGETPAVNPSVSITND